MGYVMQVKGHGVVVDWDGETLTARGTNAATHKALAGDLSHEGDVIIARDDIARVSYKPPKRLTNGLLNIRTTDNRRYQLHFLKRHAEGFEPLARDLGATGV